jgi:hypothetical protein
MNDEAQGAQAPEEEGETTTPTPIVRGATVKQILGRIEAGGMKPSGKAAANNTRWVFDVKTKDGEPIQVKLRHYNSGRLCDPDVMSFTATPTNRAAYAAKPVLAEEKNGLRIETEKTGEYATFRVFVDVMHSATR